MKRIFLIIASIAVLSTGCVPQSGVSSPNAIITPKKEYRLSEQPITKTIEVPITGYNGEQFSSAEIAQMVARKLASKSTYERFHTWKPNEHVVRQKGVRAYKSGTSEAITVEYDGGSEIKSFKNKLSITKADLPVSLAGKKMSVTLPVDFDVISQQGFSIMPVKQLDNETNLKYDMQNMFKQLQEKDTYCAIYSKTIDVQVNKPISKIIENIKSFSTHPICFTNKNTGLRQCNTLYKFPTLDPARYRECYEPSNEWLAVKDNYIGNYIYYSFKQYMAGYKVTFDVNIPYFVSSDGSIEYDSVTETLSNITNQLNK